MRRRSWANGTSAAPRRFTRNGSEQLYLRLPFFPGTNEETLPAIEKALAANTLIHSGDDAAKAAHLPGIAAGETIATLAFTHSKGCLDGCRGACMCSCGYAHYEAQVRIESNEKCMTDECENLTHLVLCDKCTDEQSGHWESQKER
jgi:hypothetical protein